MEFVKPEEIIDDLPLEKNMIAADFGCGSGGWVVPLSKRLKEGVIYAIDILEEPLSALRGKMKRNNIANIKVVNENIEKGTHIQDGKVDLVLMTNFLFQVENKEKVVSEARRILRKEGLLLTVEWEPESPIAPKVEKLSPGKTKNLIEDAGFKLEEEFQAGMHHYGFLHRK